MGAKKDKTLCWNCAKACGKCSWSGGKFIPVEGWVAVPNYVESEQGKVRSYTIISCPEFVRDVPIADKRKVKGEKGKSYETKRHN